MGIIRIIKKYNLILSKHQKVRILELGVLMIIAGFMEMLSVSLMLPFMEAIMQPDDFMAKGYIRKMCVFLGIEKQKSFLLVLATFLALIYVIKNSFLLFQMMVQTRFVNYNRFMVQKRLLSNYLNRPYEFFLDVKSGDAIQVVNVDTKAVFDLLMTLLSFFSESIVSLTLIVTIFVISPIVTLVVAGILLTVVFIMQFGLRPWLKKIGAESRNASAKMHQWLLQAINGIKEIKIMQREKFFLRKYSEKGEIQVRSTYLFAAFSQVPRYMIEAVSMATFFIGIVVMIIMGVELTELIPMLSSIAIAAIRLLPAANRISGCLANLSYNEASLNALYEKISGLDGFANEYNRKSLCNPVHTKNEEDRSKVILALKDVTYKYPKGEDYILQNVNLEIEEFDSVGIVGASGSGKTTTMDILLGLLDPARGSVLYRGCDIKGNKEFWLSHVGYIPQTIFILDGNIRDNVAMGIDREKIDDQKVWEVLKEAALDDFVRNLPLQLDTELGEQGIRLSGGQRQRIGIARALYSNPDILFFDEATSSLDNETEETIMESIKKLQGNKTIVIIAHRLSTIQDCNHIYRVANQQINKER